LQHLAQPVALEPGTVVSTAPNFRGGGGFGRSGPGPARFGGGGRPPGFGFGHGPAVEDRVDAHRFFGPGPVIVDHPVVFPHIPLGPGPVIPISAWRIIDKEATDIALSQTSAVEGYLHQTFNTYNPVEYATVSSGLIHTTYYIVIETGELTVLVLGAPQTSKFFIEIAVNHNTLDGSNTLVSAFSLTTGLPPISPDNNVSVGSGGGLAGPFPITPELAQAAITFRPQVQQYTGVTYTIYEPQTYYSQVVAGTNYNVYVKTGDGPNAFVYVKLFLALTPGSQLSFVSASQQLN